MKNRIGVGAAILFLTVFLIGCGDVSLEKTGTGDGNVSYEESSKAEPETGGEAASEERKEEAVMEEKEQKQGTEQEKGSTPVERHGALSVQGSVLTGENGEAVQLAGISTHGIGTYPQYVNEEAFRQFRDEWGTSLIRLAMYTEEEDGYLSDGDQSVIEETMTRGIDICIDLGLYCIVDWHILSDYDPNWHKEEAKAFFERITKKYGSCPNVIYEICNEPNGGIPWETVKAYADEVIPVIRANAPDAVILVGTPNWCQDIDLVASAPVSNPKNVMYTFHFYAATHGDFLREKLLRAVDQGTPVFVSEFGICEANGSGNVDYDSADRWMEAINRHKLSYAVWNLSNKDETSAMLRPECTKTYGFTDEDLTENGKWIRGTESTAQK